MKLRPCQAPDCRVDGGEARQAGDRLGVEAAELRHLGQQARRGDARHARDRRQDLGPPGQSLVFGQPLPDLGIDGGQMPVELRQPSARRRWRGWSPRRPGAPARAPPAGWQPLLDCRS